MALDVSALNDFNNEVAGELITKMVYGGSTMEYVTIKEGVKFQEPINLMEVDHELRSMVYALKTWTERTWASLLLSLVHTTRRLLWQLTIQSYL